MVAALPSVTDVRGVGVRLCFLVRILFGVLPERHNRQKILFQKKIASPQANSMKERDGGIWGVIPHFLARGEMGCFIIATKNEKEIFR